jgi:hypothetical protein
VGRITKTAAAAAKSCVRRGLRVLKNTTIVYWKRSQWQQLLNPKRDKAPAGQLFPMK